MINPKGRPNVSDDNTIRPDEQRLVEGVELLKATEGHILPDARPGKLSGEHAAYLESQAVSAELAEGLGVRSLMAPADTAELGDVWVNWANFPAILFPWVSQDGRVEYQVRPDNPTQDSRGRDRKYVFRRGMEPVLWAVRPLPGAERMLIVEGTKQSLAAASYAPPGVAVYGMAGCRMWQIDGRPIPDLALADGREVVVILDADASSNPDVYAAGLGLAEALAMEGATKVSFGRLPGGDSKAGLDDVLAGRTADRRAGYLARIVDGAKLKPADAKPKPRKKGSDAPSGEDGRVTIVCNQDRRDVISALTGALLDRWNARELFNHGGVISRLVDGARMQPVDRGTFHDIVQDTAVTVNENSGADGLTTYAFTWPDAGTMAATMSRSEKFAHLDRISHAPFVRPDGTIVTEPGYDEATRTILMSDEVLAGLEVPEDPDPSQIAAARDLILEDWLGDFPFDGDADRANVLALIVTPAIRGMVPKVPLAVVDGLQMGVGKNLLADCLLTVYTGAPAQPMNWVPEPEELRKQITSAFRTGAEFFLFDEAHTLEGAPLAQALTAETWQDRILGVSTMAEFPNKVTWISLGNQVQVRGDLTRRVYRIALRPQYANPQDRDASSFRHPGQSGLDLGSWTRKHRRELLTAILTIVRAWFAQGSPRPKRGVSFGSFEIWERIVGGIVETAGLEGFLSNLKVWRSESDFDTQYWLGHLGWLHEQFGENPFRTADVKNKALSDPAAYLAPPKLDDPADRGYGKALGEAYSRLRGRRYDGYWMERVGSSHGHVSNWRVFSDAELPPPPRTPEPPVDPEPDQTPEPAPENEHAEARGPAPEDTDGEGHDEVRGAAEPDHVSRMHPDGFAMTYAPPGPDTEMSTDVLTVDLETGDARNLYKAGPGYVRIGATAADDGDVQTYDGSATWTGVPREVAADIRRAKVITGHNIMAFDLPALVREGALTMPEVHEMAAAGRLADALLIARYQDPPMAKDQGVDQKRKYDLGALGEKHGLGQKLTDVSAALADKYGGWDNIPIDDSEDGRAFKGYMVQDVELSRRLYPTLLDELGGTMPDYLVREHRVAALATQISVNGFRVDPDLLAERVALVNATKRVALGWLAENCGIPLADAKGKPYKSPLASKAGKEALEAALRAAGVTSIWRTGKSQDLDTSGNHMKHLGQEYHHLPKVVEIAKNVYRIVGARSVYQTVTDHTGPDGRVHPKISFEQATGRWSVTSPGLTVLGKRGGRHVERAILLPDPGEVLLSFDLSQVDMRAIAGLSQDQAYIEMLKHDDPHAEIAFALFGDRSLREIAKPIGHGWNYGRGIKAISEGNDIDPALVRRFDQSMRDRFGRVVEWQGEVRALAESGALLDNGFGRLMRADPFRAHTQGPALMGQGAARDIMMEGMLRLPAEVLPMLRAQIHDEIVLSVPIDQVQDVSRAVIDALSFEWRGVPILADVSPAGTNWSLCYVKA
jgi:hypothetical protein